MIEIFDKNCNDLDVISMNVDAVEHSIFGRTISIKTRIDEVSKKLQSQQSLYDVNGNCYIIIRKRYIANESSRVDIYENPDDISYVVFECRIKSEFENYLSCGILKKNKG
jgi:hypothetical protein